MRQRKFPPSGKYTQQFLISSLKIVHFYQLITIIQWPDTRGSDIQAAFLYHTFPEVKYVSLMVLKE